jgi:hypothetical protein
MARKPQPTKADYVGCPHADQGVAAIGPRRYVIDLTSGRLEADLDGVCWHMPLSGIVTVDPTLRGKEFCESLIHEVMHGYFDHPGILSKEAHKRREDIITEFSRNVVDILFTQEALRRAGF